MLLPKTLIIFGAALLCSIFNVQAQQQVLFKIKYLPNHSYTSTSNISINIVMNVDSPQTAIDKIKAQGVQLPMIMKGENRMAFEVKTGSDDSKKIFPIVLKYTDASATRSIAGVVVPDAPNPLKGQSIYAHGNAEGKLEVDSIPGKQLNDTIKNALTSMISNLTQQIKFPEKPMAIGDTFDQEVPFSMPVSGIAMNMTIKITYKFIGVKDRIALFDLVQTCTYKFSKSQGDVNMVGYADGTGDGKLAYFIDENMTKQLLSSFTLNYKMKMNNEMKMTGTAQTYTTVNYSISK
ncbi:hypothetical protein [Mucilaginibacter jinjuensis]|uniref:Uncharacterized protein n=1 Tax=Mucilaginibacter jinjuensis TaxID=1176721 RepID=A0ABY7T7R0_9SPHI|nr:hypothetical protein [Mucilaginibacter jinjuensis]WCT12319.1 hypothetical protein PQO05_00025 [Mucilaginibacter jinjuensis]